jgi:hypothetical protein
MYYMYIDMENQRKVGIILPIVENYWIEIIFVLCRDVSKNKKAPSVLLAPGCFSCHRA